MNFQAIIAMIILSSGLASTTIIESTQMFADLAQNTVNDTLNCTHGLMIIDKQVNDDQIILWVKLLPGSSPIQMSNISIYHNDIEVNYTYKIFHGNDILEQGTTGKIYLPSYSEFDLIVNGGYNIKILVEE